MQETPGFFTAIGMVLRGLTRSRDSRPQRRIDKSPRPLTNFERTVFVALLPMASVACCFVFVTLLLAPPAMGETANGFVGMGWFYCRLFIAFLLTPTLPIVLLIVAVRVAFSDRFSAFTAGLAIAIAVYIAVEFGVASFLGLS